MANDIQNSHNEKGVLVVKAKKELQEKYGDCIDDFKQVLSFVKLINESDKLENKTSIHSGTIVSKSIFYILNNLRYDQIFNINKDIISVNNGIIEFKTMTLRKRRAEDRVTYKSPKDYDPTKGEEYFNNLINSAFSFNPEYAVYLQSYLGYAITGHTNQNKFLIVHGTGSNMKSVIDSQNQLVFGDTIYHTMSKDALTSKGGNNDEIYNLKSARIFSINETGEEDQFNWEMIKKLVGGDTINVSAKFKGCIKFNNQSCPIIWTNNKPKLPINATFAEKRRVTYVDAKKQFLDMNNQIDKLEWSQYKQDQGLIGVKNTDLLIEMAKKGSEYLNWVLIGTKRFYDNGMKLIIPDSVNEHIMEEIQSQDVIGTFINDSTTVDKESFIPTPDLYNLFIELCGVDVKEYSKRKFATKLTQLGFDTTVRKRIDSKQVRCTIGLKLKEDIENEDEVELIKENDPMSISFMD